MTMEPKTAVKGDIETSLLRAVVGYRVFGAGWLTVLAAITLAGEVELERPAVVAGMLGVAGAWTAFTVWLSVRRPDALRGVAYLASDVLVAAATLAGGSLAGAGGFAGGYPLAAVFHGVYATGSVGGSLAAAALSAVASWQVLTSDTMELTAGSGAVLVYGFAAAAAAWAVGVIRRGDARRAAAESALEQERTDRVRAEERARLAARIHDGVLQTLALIQQNREDPPRVAQLARRQERDLREVLYGRAVSGDGFRGSLIAAAADVEELCEVRVDVVVVGDRPWDDEVAAIVLAAREAMLNAARHSGASDVAVYGEADQARLEVFVRDRGEGFEVAAVPESRRGLADSVRGRLAAAGGAAEVRSAPGEGTEVRLVLGGGRS